MKRKIKHLYGRATATETHVTIELFVPETADTVRCSACERSIGNLEVSIGSHIHGRWHSGMVNRLHEMGHSVDHANRTITFKVKRP